MFNRKFWKEAGEAFALAAAVVLVSEGADVLTQPGWDTALPALAAVARAAVVAGLRAVAPRFLALRKEPNG